MVLVLLLLVVVGFEWLLSLSPPPPPPPPPVVVVVVVWSYQPVLLPLLLLHHHHRRRSPRRQHVPTRRPIPTKRLVARTILLIQKTTTISTRTSTTIAILRRLPTAQTNHLGNHHNHPRRRPPYLRDCVDCNENGKMRSIRALPIIGSRDGPFVVVVVTKHHHCNHHHHHHHHHHKHHHRRHRRLTYGSDHSCHRHTTICIVGTFPLPASPAVSMRVVSITVALSYHAPIQLIHPVPFKSGLRQDVSSLAPTFACRHPPFIPKPGCRDKCQFETWSKPCACTCSHRLRKLGVCRTCRRTNDETMRVNPSRIRVTCLCIVLHPRRRRQQQQQRQQPSFGLITRT